MFKFKKFSIAQDRSAMKVGTDGVLLGAWVSLQGDECRMLDIGSGTGLIALMLAQRSCNFDKQIAIDGVELDLASCGQAVENVDSSPWNDRVTMHHSDIQSYEAKRYDLIVSNPPFFVDSLLAPNEERSNARHTTQLPFPDLIDSVLRLLKPNGHFALILPTAEQQLFDREVAGRLKLLRRCAVKGSVRSMAKRQLSEYLLTDVAVEAIHEELTLRSADGTYSDEYRNLTRYFYLKF